MYDGLQQCGTLQEAREISHCKERISTLHSMDCYSGQIEEPLDSAGTPGTLCNATDEASCLLCGTLATHQR